MSDAPPALLTKEHGPVIITVAMTGNLNTKERNPDLPCTPQEIADDVHKCAELGAVFFHIHARDANNKPTMDPSTFREICRLIKKRDPEVILQISTGGRAPPEGVKVDPITWRIQPLDLLPESGSFTPGSVNLEPIVYANSPELVTKLAEKYRDTGIKPEIECFDSNMITKADALVKKGLLTRPIHFGFVMGAPGGQDASLGQLAHLVSKLQPGDTWQTIGVGKYSLPLGAAAIAMGGHVRVGLEDNNKSPDGKVCTNLELVQHVVEVAKAMGREIASPEEAREILSMPKENADWILAKLDPSVKLESLVSNMTPYQGLEPIEGSLEMAPSKAHPDSPEGLSLPAYDAGLAASRA